MPAGVLPGFPSYGWRVLITAGAAIAGLAAVAAMLTAFLGAARPGAASAGTVVALIVFAVATAVTLASLARGARRERAERAAGYSTAFDVPGLELRHPRTGAIVRGAGVATGDLGIRRAQWRRG